MTVSLTCRSDLLYFPQEIGISDLFVNKLLLTRLKTRAANGVNVHMRPLEHR